MGYDRHVCAQKLGVLALIPLCGIGLDGVLGGLGKQTWHVKLRSREQVEERRGCDQFPQELG